MFTNLFFDMLSLLGCIVVGFAILYVIGLFLYIISGLFD